MTHQRCAEHDLAVGPGGECVLCRRARPRPRAASARPRWLAPALLAAGLGTTLLGGVALARSRTSLPPVEATTTPEPMPIAAPPAEAEIAPSHPIAQAQPCEPPPAATPHAGHHTAQPPPRDYLGEAYAAMPKGNLYDEAPAPTKQASGGAECPCKQGGGCTGRVYTRGGGVPSQQLRYGPAPGTPGMIGTPNAPMYASGGGMPASHSGPPSSMSPSSGGGRLR